MALKRQANPYVNNSTDTLGRKRLKRSYTVISSSESEVDDGGVENSDIGDDEWLIKCILDENESQYLIDWEGPWSPTWEPKENANDVAVRVWDEKKQGDSTQEVQQSIEETQRQRFLPTLTGAARRSFQSESPSIERDYLPANYLGNHSFSSSNSYAAPLASAGQEEVFEFSNGEHHFSFDRQFSPLFVTPEPVTRLQSRKDEGEALEEIPETLWKDSKLPASVSAIDCNGSECGQVIFKLEETYSTSLFEYIPLSPIPPEYRLSGEKDTLDSSAYTPALKSRGSTSDTTDELKYHDSLEFQGCSPRESSQKIKEIDEIAETPPVRLIDAGRKANLREPDTEDVGVSSSYFATASGQNSLYNSAKPTTFAGNPSSLSPAAVTVGLSNSVQNTIQPGEPQIPEQPHSQPKNSEQTSTQPSHSIPRVPQDKMDKESPKKPLSHADLMEKYSHIPGATMAEKMNNAQADMRERSLEPFNLLRASVKPSEPPARAASAELTHPQGHEVGKGHVRHSTLPPIPGPVLHQPEVPYPRHEEHTVQTIQPSALTVNYTQPTRGSVQLGPSEFAITLPMDSRLKDDYEQALKRDIRSIREFIDMGSAGSTGTTLDDVYPQLESKMNGILEQLGNITTHPDLNMLEHIRESQSNLEQEAFWGEYSSSKFLLLSYLLRVASGQDLHFVITVQGPKLLDIVERFLLGKGLAYTRPRQEMGPGTDLEVSMVKHSLSFGIQTTRSDGIIQTCRPPSVIIALDRSFNALNPSVEHMRTTYARNGHLLPVIRLLVSNTSEHIERCLVDVSPQQRLRLLMHHTTELADVVGELQDNALNVQEDAEEILACLISDSFDAHWSLPPIEPLQILEPEELDAFLREHQGNVSLGQPTTRKRSVQPEEDTMEQTLKRPRTDTVVAEVRDERSNLPIQTPDTGLEAPEAKAESLAELDRLRKALADSESLLEQRVKIHEELQHRYESRTKDLHKIRRERDSLATAKVSLVERVERLREENAKLKDERTELKGDLRHARETILSGSGSAAELETANEEIRRLRAENTSLERKADYEKNQGEYTREQYQTASTVAAQSGNEIRQLKAENEMLKRKVAGEASRLREVNLKSDQDRNLSRVMELELTLANRDDLLRRKEEELREIRKNRPSTRSTSTQPRSPKISTANSRPSSPGLNNNNHNGSTPIGRGSALRFSSEAR